MVRVAENRMTEHEAADLLNQAYNNPPDGEREMAVFLFSIRYVQKP